MAESNVITQRKVRAYTGTKNGNLVPIGGFKEGKMLKVDDTELRFNNAERPVLMAHVPGMQHVYILKSPNNIKETSVFDADSGPDEHKSAFVREFKIPSFVLDYKSEMQFLNAEGKWDDELGFPDGGHDSLLDDVYYNNDGGGFLTVQQIAALKPKDRKKYQKALKLQQKQTALDAAAADTEQNKAITDSIAAPDAPVAPPPKESGFSPIVIGGIALGGLLLIGGLIFALKGKGKKAGAGPSGGGPV